MSFCRALTTSEEKDFKKTTNQALEALDIDDGMHIFKIFQTALPNDEGQNLGIGKLNSDKAVEYLKFMSLYTGSNTIKVYPMGQIPSKLRFENYYCPYERSATVIGEDNINLFKLTTPNYGSLLDEQDIKPFMVSDDTQRVNYENELDEKSGVIFGLIEKAYDNMQKANTTEGVAIRKEFEKFKQSLQSDTMDRLAITPFIKAQEPDFFLGIDNSSKKQAQFEKYKQKYEKEIDVFKFGKFLALKNLKEAKNDLNKNGLELCGDCPIGFSEDEVFCFPEAFYSENISPGWGFRGLRYGEVFKEGTVANRLFSEKIKWHLENFDSIRFDVGWQYFQPSLMETDENGNATKLPLVVGEDVVNYIENMARAVKGEDFDVKKLMYEADAGADDFQMFYWNNGKATIKEVMKNRTAVLTSVYEHAEGFGWGNPDFYYRAGLRDYVIGTNNHDGVPLNSLAHCKDSHFERHGVDAKSIKDKNINALFNALGLSKASLQKPQSFIKAKFAELFQAKNHFLFFNDVIGNNNRLDTHSPNPEDYRLKITDNFEEQYHTALQEQRGFNLAESLKLAMKAKKLDVSEPQLYKDVEYYSELLYSKGPKTKAEAEKQLGKK